MSTTTFIILSLVVQFLAAAPIDISGKSNTSPIAAPEGPVDQDETLPLLIAASFGALLVLVATILIKAKMRRDARAEFDDEETEAMRDRIRARIQASKLADAARRQGSQISLPEAVVNVRRPAAELHRPAVFTRSTLPRYIIEDLSLPPPVYTVI